MNQRRRAQEIIIQPHSSLPFPSASSIFHWPHREHGAAASPGNQRVKDALRQSVQVSLPGHTAGWRRVEVDLERLKITKDQDECVRTLHHSVVQRLTCVLWGQAAEANASSASLPAGYLTSPAALHPLPHL